ncbi:hypothetical protein HXX76_007224 [Chlamydomonas incerta]|uniref:C-type lectin domain-containing protein n=1 Tax=Chlamydomonas incerta TaxID=51695 RepID=A0A835T7C6_CHLIN|nr:hypothetical protein HXX76_007224 [Chlamydomonas incerta]|eukprot:KAG2435139.1 hypothetical protein HXX76_007224 [Chlamydomonas incerta]
MMTLSWNLRQPPSPRSPPPQPRAPPAPPRPPPFPPPPPFTMYDGPVVNLTYGGYVYEGYGWQTTWELAEAFCVQRRGGHLVSILSADEAQALRPLALSTMRAVSWWSTPLWIGLRGTPPSLAAWRAAGFGGDYPVATRKEDYTAWTDGSATAGYTNWTPGELRNAQLQKVGLECAQMTDSWLWVDAYCNDLNKAPFVCKIPAEGFALRPPESPPPPPLTDCPAGQRLCGAGTADACCGVMCCGNLCCPVTWRVLAVVVPRLDLTWNDTGTKRVQRIATNMTQAEIAGAGEYVRRLPGQLLDYSGGAVTATVDVEVATGVLSAMDRYADLKTVDSFWPSPGALHNHVVAAARGRPYDAVITVTKMAVTGVTAADELDEVPRHISDDGSTWYGLGGCCWGGLGFPWPVGAITFAVPPGGAFSQFDVVLIHEFGHVMEGWYGSQPGVTYPCLHCLTPEYGYQDRDMAFRDFYRGQVWSAKENRYIGWNKTVYGFGTPSRPSKPPPWNPATEPGAPPRHPPLSPLQPPSPYAPWFPNAPSTPPTESTAGATATDASGRFGYAAYFTTLNWEDADSYCRTRHNGHLASVHSNEEAQIVADLAERTLPLVPAWMPKRYMWSNQFWIGLRCSPDPPSGTTCADRSNYTAWSDGSSCDKYGWGQGALSPYGASWFAQNGACATTAKWYGWRWDAAWCGAKIGFICKWLLA